MTPKQAMAALRKAGTEQNRKIYKRHGVGEPLLGVSFAAMKKLAKEIGTDHPLALELWETGNHDARMLAAMVADPAALGRSELDAWVREIDNYVLSDAFATLVAKSPHADSRADKWTRSRREFVAHTGWNLVGGQAMAADDRPDSYFEERLRQIEATMPGAANRTKHAMHMTLIAIGGRTPGLRRRAAAVTRRLGTPDVDHGETSCTTPDAIPYIDRMWDRKEAKQARQAAKTGAAGRNRQPAGR